MLSMGLIDLALLMNKEVLFIDTDTSNPDVW